MAKHTLDTTKPVSDASRVRAHYGEMGPRAGSQFVVSVRCVEHRCTHSWYYMSAAGAAAATATISGDWVLDRV